MVLEYEDEETFRSRFARQLQQTREELDLTQEVMAGKLGVKESTYAKYETRSHFPSYLLPRLIIFSGKSFAYWCYGLNETPSAEKGKGRRHLRSVN